MKSKSTESKNPLTDNFSYLSSDERAKIILDEYKKVISKVYDARDQIRRVEDFLTEKIRSQKSHVIFVGAGSSGRRGFQEAAEMHPTFGVDYFDALIAGGLEALVKSIEGAEDNYEQGIIDIREKAKKYDIVFGISASGKTPYVIGALDEAKRIKCYTISLSNNSNSIIYKKSDFGIIIETGPEIITGSTRMKADLSHKIVLNTITTNVMANLGYVKGNLMINVQERSKKLKIRKLAIIILQNNGLEYEECLRKAQVLLDDVNYNLEEAIKKI